MTVPVLACLSRQDLSLTSVTAPPAPYCGIGFASEADCLVPAADPTSLLARVHVAQEVSLRMISISEPGAAEMSQLSSDVACDESPTRGAVPFHFPLNPTRDRIVYGCRPYWSCFLRWRRYPQDRDRTRGCLRGAWKSEGQRGPRIQGCGCSEARSRREDLDGQSCTRAWI